MGQDTNDVLVSSMTGVQIILISKIEGKYFGLFYLLFKPTPPTPLPMVCIAFGLQPNGGMSNLFSCSAG